MYECGSYRGITIAALIPVLACVPLLFQGSRGVDEPTIKVDAPRVDEPQIRPERVALDRAAHERELEQEVLERQVLERRTWEVLAAWEHEHPDKGCPDTVDELNKFLGVSNSPDRRKLWCRGAGLREPTILIAEEEGGNESVFDPGEIQNAAVRQLVDDVLNHFTLLATKRRLDRYAFEAYPLWAAAHPGKGCPARLDELNEYMDVNHINDAWGRPIKMFCGPNLRAGLKGLYLLSVGEDGKEGTDDDITSWEFR